MRLTSVVFPAPFGPMRPKACFAAIARSTSATAATPPKRLSSLTVSSNIGGSDPGQVACLADLGERREPARKVDDDAEQDQALEDVAVVLQRTKDLREGGEEGRAQDRAEDRGRAADDGEHEDLHGMGEAEVGRLDREALMRG